MQISIEKFGKVKLLDRFYSYKDGRGKAKVMVYDLSVQKVLRMASQAKT
jgi:hypothetical protein